MANVASQCRSGVHVGYSDETVAGVFIASSDRGVPMPGILRSVPRELLDEGMLLNPGLVREGSRLHADLLRLWRALSQRILPCLRLERREALFTLEGASFLSLGLEHGRTPLVYLSPTARPQWNACVERSLAGLLVTDLLTCNRIWLRFPAVGQTWTDAFERQIGDHAPRPPRLRFAPLFIQSGLEWQVSQADTFGAVRASFSNTATSDTRSMLFGRDGGTRDAGHTTNNSQ
jgi:hypothetical protein